MSTRERALRLKRIRELKAEIKTIEEQKVQDTKNYHRDVAEIYRQLDRPSIHVHVRDDNVVDDVVKVGLGVVLGGLFF